MADYAPITREDLRVALARDLRDPDMKTFTDLTINDLINQSIVEVSRIYPRQGVIEILVEASGQRQFTVDAKNIFRVELIKDGEVYYGVPRTNGSMTAAEDGWDFHAGILWMPQFASHRLEVGDSTPSVRIWGYWPREIMYDDTETLDGDAEFEFAVRTYALLLGYQRLQNDRLLFQQWLTTTGNTDVSPNQLGMTADMYMSQWRELRNRLRGMQRV